MSGNYSKTAILADCSNISRMGRLKGYHLDDLTKTFLEMLVEWLEGWSNIIIKLAYGDHGHKFKYILDDSPPVKKHSNIIVPNSEAFFNFLLSYSLI